MARTVTLLQLRTDARLYADQRPASETNAFVNKTELNRLVNQALTELYDLLVAARGQEYYLTETTWTLTTDNQVPSDPRCGRFNLPAGFYQLAHLVIEWATNDNEPVPPYDAIRARTSIVNIGTWSAWAPKGYRLRATQLEIVPKPTTATVMRMQYIPAFTDLVNDGDTFDGVNGWEKLVALKAAMELRAIEESGYSDLEKLYEREKRRIEDLAAERDAQSPSIVQDVSPEGGYRRGWPPWPGRVTT